MHSLLSNKQLKKENSKWPMVPVEIPREDWPKQQEHDAERLRVLRSRGFLIQVFRESGHIRISVNRTLLNKNGLWRDDISWDELQKIKAWCGHKNSQAVEIYPREQDVVNVANMRHLWILQDTLPFGWVSDD